LTVLDYASRWYSRADQWLTYGGIAYAAADHPRAVRAYGLAYQLEPDVFDPSQLNAYASVLDRIGDWAQCEDIANQLLRTVGDDLAWKTTAWHHLACACLGQGKFDEAIDHAARALAHNPRPERGEAFGRTLEQARDHAKPTAVPATGLRRPRLPIHVQLEAGDLAGAAEQVAQGPWRVRRAALHAARFRLPSENQVEVTPRARAASAGVLADTVGTMDREALAARALALRIREQAYFPRDPVPTLGERMTREAFYAELAARGSVVLGGDAAPPVAFVDRDVVPNSKIARASDYIALLRDLAAMEPREALAQFDLDETGYLEVARAWAAAMDDDPTIAVTINAGLAKR
jgi:tetratricopeptide (TPR) repeat protein